MSIPVERNTHENEPKIPHPRPNKMDLDFAHYLINPSYSNAI